MQVAYKYFNMTNWVQFHSACSAVDKMFTDSLVHVCNIHVYAYVSLFHVYRPTIHDVRYGTIMTNKSVVTFIYVNKVYVCRSDIHYSIVIMIFSKQC